jgi:hypothetical protein
MSDRLLFAGGSLAPGDFLFAATDAMRLIHAIR